MSATRRVSAKPPGLVDARRDVLAYAALLALGILVRAPFLGAFDLVSHDGTYYIAQARALLHGHLGGGAFPPGYPAAVALFMTVIGDDVRAAQVVSVLAGLAATLLIYLMGRERFGRGAAWICAAVAATTPLFVRLSLMTMSEALYVALLTGALLAALRSRAGSAGLLAGLAAATRPEALAVAAVIPFVWRREGARARAFLLAFVAVYAVAATLVSVSAGRLVLLSKSTPLGADPADHYLFRLSADIAALFRHLGPAAFALGLWGAWRRRGVVAAALLPALVNPLFTPRFEDRFVLPFVLPALWLAFDASAALATARARRIAMVSLVVSGALAFAVNRGALTTPVSPGFEGARATGLELRPHVTPGARVADRKPFVAFYAQARYVEIPDGPYDAVLARLHDDGVEFLSLLPGVVEFFRPELRALLYDAAAIEGELRYAQLIVSPEAVVYARREPAVTPRWHPVTALGAARPGAAPSLSPAGERALLAWGRFLLAVDLATGRADTVYAGSARLADAAYAPDGKRIAFVATEGGNADVHVLELASGRARVVAADRARDTEPAWDGSGAVVFTSDRGGVDEIWRADIADGRLQQITHDGPNAHPSVSGDGRRLAWVRRGLGVAVLDREHNVGLQWDAPREVVCAPAWSPDGSVMAVAAAAWERVDLYLLPANVTRALRVACGPSPTNWPCWLSGGRGVVAIVERDGVATLTKIEGLDAHIARLSVPAAARTLVIRQ